jgi:hypothetical protein
VSALIVHQVRLPVLVTRRSGPRLLGRLARRRGFPANLTGARYVPRGRAVSSGQGAVFLCERPTESGRSTA